MSAPDSNRTSRRSREAPCEECRKRKIKCDGRKPGCETCERRKVRCGGYEGRIIFVNSSCSAIQKAQSRQSLKREAVRQPKPDLDSARKRSRSGSTEIEKSTMAQPLTAKYLATPQKATVEPIDVFGTPHLPIAPLTAYDTISPEQFDMDWKNSTELDLFDFMALESRHDSSEEQFTYSSKGSSDVISPTASDPRRSPDLVQDIFDAAQDSFLFHFIPVSSHFDKLRDQWAEIVKHIHMLNNTQSIGLLGALMSIVVGRATKDAALLEKGRQLRQSIDISVVPECKITAFCCALVSLELDLIESGPDASIDEAFASFDTSATDLSDVQTPHLDIALFRYWISLRIVLLTFGDQQGFCIGLAQLSETSAQLYPMDPLRQALLGHMLTCEAKIRQIDDATVGGSPDTALYNLTVAQIELGSLSSVLNEWMLAFQRSHFPESLYVVVPGTLDRDVPAGANRLPGAEQYLFQGMHIAIPLLLFWTLTASIAALNCRVEDKLSSLRASVASISNDEGFAHNVHRKTAGRSLSEPFFPRSCQFCPILEDSDTSRHCVDRREAIPDHLHPANNGYPDIFASCIEYFTHDHCRSFGPQLLLTPLRNESVHRQAYYWARVLSDPSKRIHDGDMTWYTEILRAMNSRTSAYESPGASSRFPFRYHLSVALPGT